MITGKKPVTGNNVSHSNRKTKRRFCPNLHWKTFVYEGRRIRLRISAKGLKIVDKIGLDEALKLVKKNGF